MAGLLKISELEARKRALAAESEVFRQTLTLEVHNVRLYSARVRRRLSFFSPSNPVFMFVAPLLGTLFKGSLFGGFAPKRRRKSKFRIVGVALLAWQLLRRFGPLLATLLMRRAAYVPNFSEEDEEETPAANI